MNVLDEGPQSYSHQGNRELDQTKYIVKTQDREFVDSKVPKLLSRVYAFCEEGHVIMDFPFVTFHIKINIVKHVELQNVART